MPKFQRHQLIWIALAVIIAVYVFLPQAGLTNVLRQIFHVVFSQLLAWFG